MTEPGGSLAVQEKRTSRGSAGGRTSTWSAVETLAVDTRVVWLAHAEEEAVLSSKETEGTRAESAGRKSPGHTMLNPWL
jgi:hypothetical protein